MRIPLITALLTLCVAQAQDATHSPSLQAPSAVPTTTITDVPAGHWARDAVTLLIQKGLLLGFPDGTFRGNQPITRYEAAQIFSRLVTSGALNLPGVQAKLSPADLDTLAKGVKEVSDGLMTMGARVADLGIDLDSVKARLAQVEQTLAQVVQVGATKTDVDALAQKADQTYATRSDVQALTASAATKDQLAAVDTRVSSLEADKSARDQAAQQAAADAAKPKDDLPKPGDLPNVTFRPDPGPRYWIAGGVVKNLSDPIGFGFSFGVRNLVGPVGLEAAGEFSGGARSYGASVEAVYPLAAPDALFSPSVGGGLGVTVSPNRANSGAGALDVYASATLGLTYRFTDTLWLYVKANPRVYVTHKGDASRNFITFSAGAALNF